MTEGSCVGERRGEGWKGFILGSTSNTVRPTASSWDLKGVRGARRSWFTGTQLRCSHVAVVVMAASWVVLRRRDVQRKRNRGALGSLGNFFPRLYFHQSHLQFIFQGRRFVLRRNRFPVQSSGLWVLAPEKRRLRSIVRADAQAVQPFLGELAEQVAFRRRG